LKVSIKIKTVNEFEKLFWENKEFNEAKQIFLDKFNKTIKRKKLKK